MKHRDFRPYVILSLLFAATAHADEPAANPDAGVDFFEKKVRPMLVSHCYSCHSADTKLLGELRVDDRNGLLMGGKSGPAIVPGDPDKSLLLKRVRGTLDARHAQMPKEGDLLTDEEIADLAQWIKEGVAWPREHIPASLGRTRPAYEKLKQEHWAWQPLKSPEPPEVKDTFWPRTGADRFILAALEAKGLAPVPEADPATLLRRVTFDLTGLPPTPDELKDFTVDTTPDAYDRVVDRLLASRAFGERWGRHWLDVARYGESTGPSRNIPYPYAWKYRDYVIDAINRDLPYDRFLQEQIAGDLLPAENPEEQDRLRTATGFLALGVKDVNQRFKIRFIMDNVDEQIDAVTRSTLALTVTCARCHDHKFDPIPTTDYYSLAGIFTSTEDCAGVRNKMGGGGLDYYAPTELVVLHQSVAPAPADEVEKLTAQVDEAKEAFDAIRGTPEGLAKGPNGQPVQRPYRLKYEKLRGELMALTDPASRGQAVHGVREAKTVADTEVRIRGEAERLGPTVPRGFLTAFAVPGAAPVDPQQSGRLQLAQWITNPKNPLTSRVYVNRVWEHLFGAGLVITVDNFGVKGDAPSNPELLDYLAHQFVDNGWSLKKLVRTLVLSSAYRLGSEAPEDHVAVDPADRLVWRHAPRRLDAEEMRDTILATSGQLDLAPSSAPAGGKLRMIELRDNGPEARAIHEAANSSHTRSVYLPLLRGLTPASLEAFDPVSQTLVTGQRESTTVPTQALFLLNSSFVQQQSLNFAEKLQGSGEAEIAGVQRLYELALGRLPKAGELARAHEFLLSYTAAADPGAAAPAESTATPSADEEKPVVPETPINPDDVDHTPLLAREAVVKPRTPEQAAWMSLVQAVYASAEFRFVR